MNKEIESRATKHMSGMTLYDHQKHHSKRSFEWISRFDSDSQDQQHKIEAFASAMFLIHGIQAMVDENL